MRRYLPSISVRYRKRSSNKMETKSKGVEVENIASLKPLMPFFVIKATAIASLGGILFGYDMGVISGALPQLAEEFSLTDVQQEWVVGILYLGGGLGASVGGMLCDAVGRKVGIMVTDILFVIGSMILFFAPNLNQLLLGRVVVGFAISISGIADVAYLHEIAPREWRGSIVSVNEACISLGFLLAFIIAVLLNNMHGGWRHMLGISGWLAVIQLVGMMAMPESPVWLRQKGREEDQEIALRKIYGKDHISKETAVHSSVEQSNNNKGFRKGDGNPVSDMSHQLGTCVNIYDVPSFDEDGRNFPVGSENTPPVSRESTIQDISQVVEQYSYQCWIAIFLAVSQQLSGQASLLNYAPSIFSALGNSDLSVTLWIGGMKFVTTIVVIWFIESLGRRFLLSFGMFMIVVGQFLVAFAFSEDIDEENSRFIMTCGLIGLLGVVLGYSASFGPLTWLLTSELFPSDIRGRALGVSTILTYLCASLVTSTFLSMERSIGANNVFFLYGLITLAALVFVRIAIPETGNKSSEEIHECLKEMWFWKRFQKGEIGNTSLSQTQINAAGDGTNSTSVVYHAF